MKIRVTKEQAPCSLSPCSRLRHFLWAMLAFLTTAVAMGIFAWFSPPFAEKIFEISGQRNQPIDPVEIADNFYYVGSSDAASFLIVSKDGNILIDGGYEDTAPQILENIRTLGLRPKDIRLIVNSHGHFDHAAGIAQLKRVTGAKLYASPKEALLLEAGGNDDFYYGDHLTYEPLKVDHTLTDREIIRAGNISMTAHFTPGHTKGCTSWEISLTIDGKPISALLICSLSLVGSPKTVNPRYPELVLDFQNSFERLKSLPCEIFLLPHAKAFEFGEKQKNRLAGNKQAFVDPTGCAKFINDKEIAFLEKLQ